MVRLDSSRLVIYTSSLALDITFEIHFSGFIPYSYKFRYYVNWVQYYFKRFQQANLRDYLSTEYWEVDITQHHGPLNLIE